MQKETKEKIYYVDIDGILCQNTYGNYEKAQVTRENQEWIDKINELYDKGNIIIIWTARGTIFKKNKENIKKLTKKQLKDWKVSYHKLKFGKPFYHKIIDDNSINRICDL